MERKERQEKPDEFIERRIITGLIVSTDYQQAIESFWNPKLLASTTARVLAGWSIEHFQKYGCAPGRDIEDIYTSKLKAGLNPDQGEDIEDILRGLSKEYEQEQSNIPYLLDQTVEYFKQRTLQNHIEQLQAELVDGDLVTAEEIVKDYKPFETPGASGIDKYILTVDEMRSQQPKEKPLMFMKPWLQAGQFTFIFGDYGTGKSLLAVHIAYLLGLEDYYKEDCEIREWEVRNPTGCLYIDGELGAEELKERISQFEWVGKQQEHIKTKSFCLPEYQLATEDMFLLSERTNQLQVIQWLQENPDYKLLILDSVTTLFGLTEENSNSEWSSKINPFLRDLRALGVAVIILHHSGKDSSRGLRGASSMGAMAHNIYCLTNHSDKDLDAGEAWFVLSKKKQRTGGFQFKSFAIHYSQNSDETETYWEVTGATQREKEDLNDKQIIIIKHLIRGKEKQVEIAGRIGCTPAHVTQTKKRARSLGYLTEDGKPTALWDQLLDRFKNTGEDEEDQASKPQNGFGL